MCDHKPHRGRGCSSPRAKAPSHLPRLLQRLSPREPRLELVPVPDPLLPELPAEIDLAAVAKRREIDQPAVEVAKDDPDGLELDEPPPNVSEALAHEPRRLAAAVGRGDLGER